MGIGASRAKVYDEERPTTRFADVAGYEGAKREISEVVDFLTAARALCRRGCNTPRGVLMVGPPGTGKTLLARAVAGEAQVPFFALTGSSFVELFVGVGAARMRDLFAAARKAAPAIIFIDEIDAIGQRRGAGYVSNDEREQTLNQMLAEMDGFEPTASVVVLAATNRPETLDPALLRPGRFDRQVEIPLPNLRERAAILAVHAVGQALRRGRRLRRDRTRALPASRVPTSRTWSTRPRSSPCAPAADTITAADFADARDRILLGRREATNALMPDEKHAVAVHESGHALVAALSPHADPVAKVTILPAGQALGVTEQLPADERHLYPESYLKDSLAVRLGGRAAELLILGEASSGAASDLAGATDLATRMVREYGMSSRLGPVGFASGSPHVPRPRRDSQPSVRRRDPEAHRRGGLRAAARSRTTAPALLTDRRDALLRLVDDLLEHETVDGAAVTAALGGAGEPALAVGSGDSDDSLGEPHHDAPATSAARGV